MTKTTTTEMDEKRYKEEVIQKLIELTKAQQNSETIAATFCNPIGGGGSPCSNGPCDINN